MSTKKRVFIILSVVLFAIAIGVIGFLYGRYSSGAAGEKKNEEHADTNSVAKVKTAHVQMVTMHNTVTAYGTVTAALENVRVSTVPFESKVTAVPATPGQTVTAGAVLIEVEPSHEALLQLEEAKSAQKTALQNFEQVKRRLELKLVTQQELKQAQSELETAQIRLTNLEQRNISNTQIKAQDDGLVSKIDAQLGQIIAAGNPLIEIAVGSKLEIRLGVEPADVAQLQKAMPVEIHNVNSIEPNNGIGQIRLIANRINPSTRLIDVFVAMPDKCAMPLDTYVSGKIIVASKQAMAVPRSAVLTDGEHRYIFTVKDGKAVRHVVDVGLEDNSQAEVISNDVKVDDTVVIEGNYELEEGLAVEPEDAR